MIANSLLGFLTSHIIEIELNASLGDYSFCAPIALFVILAHAALLAYLVDPLARANYGIIPHSTIALNGPHGPLSKRLKSFPIGFRSPSSS